MLQQRYVDRSFAKMIAYKRILTGTLGILASVLVTVIAFMQTRPFSLMFALAVFIFAGGGAWALRDGLRLLRELAR